MDRNPLFALLFTMLVFAGAAFADPPTTLSFQAMITDGGGPVSDTLDLTFAVYDTSDAGIALWTETIPNVPIEVGLANVILGKINPLNLAFDDTYWIGLMVGANPEMTPRTELTASPYARALSPGGAVTSLNGKTDDVTLLPGIGVTLSTLGNTITVHAPAAAGGGWYVNGNDIASNVPGGVAIGDSVPEAKLHVNGGSASAGPWALIKGGGSVFDNVALRLYDTGGAAGNRTFLEWAHRGETAAAPVGRIYTRSYGSNASDGADFIFESANDNVGGFTQNQLVLKRNGRVSVGGVGGPITTFDVGGSIHAADSIMADYLELEDGAGTVMLQLVGEDPGPGLGPHLSMKNLAGDETVFLDGNYGSSASGLLLRGPGEELRVQLESRDGGTGSGASLRLFDENNYETVRLDAEEDGAGGGYFSLRNEVGNKTFELKSEEGPGFASVIRFLRNDQTTVLEHEAHEGGIAANGATSSYYNTLGTRTVSIRSSGSPQSGEIVLYDSSGSATLWIDADRNGSSRIEVDVLELNGADLSERFDVTDTDREIEPGTVVSIDPNSPGDLRICDNAYDRRVAGIIAGAGGVRTGLIMGHDGTEADGEHPVALTGRVYCFVDATHGPIEPGDLLTTSDVPGHAMKVEDHEKATGAILGKAMTGLASGRGMVLVLVSLQ